MSRTTDLVASIVSALLVSSTGWSQEMGSEYAKDYSLTDLGTVPGNPAPNGGLLIRANEPNLLYIGGSANNAAGTVRRVGLTRGIDGRIVGFGCADAEIFASTPYIDGGLIFGPGNVLIYTGYPINVIGQVPQGAVEPSRIIDLDALGIASSTGSLTIVPPGFPGAGRLKILSYNASIWYDAAIVPDGSGTFDIVEVSEGIQISGRPEGVVYIPAGNPQFDEPGVLVAEYGAGRIGAYSIDGNGDPIPSSRRDFVNGLSGAEGAAIDPVTGDFLFSTFGGGDRVIVVRGFTISPTCVGDLDGNGSVDGGDLAILLSSWGECGSCPADLDGNCMVNGTDVGVLLSAWGTCPD
ncbi:MAG: hypothetical protein ACO3EP_01240 [Phycisphaerales bacterium]|jgi:hypothetical protein